MLRALSRRTTSLQVVRRASPPYSSWLSATSRSCAGGHGEPRAQESCWAAEPRSKQTLCGLVRRHPVAVGGFTGDWPLQRTQSFHGSAVRLKKRQQPDPPPRELDLLRYDMKHLWKGPKPALYLGMAGLIPFVAPPLLMAVTETYLPELAYIQVAYGASIISFLGGSRWGFTLPESSPAKPDWINLANSVVPSLLACAAMLLSDSITPAATLVIMGLGVSLHYDLSLLPTYPSWLKALRAVLTTVAFLSLVGTLVMDGLFPVKILFSS
ncbi:transmembrane protein 69 [Gadus macrocephalus]|uniref:transmembrane protein 69 n=1 Tax=Gadus macrocephalus TaxID=80720 RepID=UPI0028CB55CA|nr:transmembrane protein 69 [Gadus macrocephalus]